MCLAEKGTFNLKVTILQPEIFSEFNEGKIRTVWGTDSCPTVDIILISGQINTHHPAPLYDIV